MRLPSHLWLSCGVSHKASFAVGRGLGEGDMPFRGVSFLNSGQARHLDHHDRISMNSW
jgi:hypothetical protein